MSTKEQSNPKSPQEILKLPENNFFFNRMEKYNEQIKDHNFLNEEKINEGIEELKLNLNNTLDVNKNSIKNYSDVLNKLIEYKDRVAHLSNRAFADYRVTSSAYNNLYKQWVGVFSIQKSQDRREGEANYILSGLHDLMVRKEIIYENLKRLAFNLSTQADLVSRKITLVQLNAEFSEENDK